MYNSDAREGKKQFFDDEMKNYALEKFQTFYMCSQQKHPIFPGETVPDTILKLKVLTPNRLAAEKAAELLNTQSHSAGSFYYWLE